LVSKLITLIGGVIWGFIFICRHRDGIWEWSVVEVRDEEEEEQKIKISRLQEMSFVCVLIGTSC
jgi:hypothetical protein